MLLQSESDWLRIDLADRKPYGDAVPDDHLLRGRLWMGRVATAESI